MMRRASLLRGAPRCGSRSSCARSARAHSPGWTPRSPSMPPGSSSPRWTPSTTRRCRPRGVTASGRVPHSRSSATMPELDAVLAAHLAHLRLLGRSERTVYDRERAVIRLAAWLGANIDSREGAGRTSHRRPGSVAPCGGDPPQSIPGQAREQGPGAGSRPVPDILLATAGDLAAWRASLAVGGHAVVVYCAHVAGFYDFAVTRGIIDSNPAAGLPVPSPPRGVPRPVSEEDLAAALACASGRVRPWLVLAGWAGMRAKEIALLKRDCVLDTAASPAILIARNATKGRRERLIPMSQFVLDELRLAGLPSHGYVFPRHDGRPGPNTPWLISQLAGRALHESGSSATLHSLRHRFASQLYQQTRDIRLVQEMLGHASPATTAVYADYGDGAAEAVGRLPGPDRLPDAC